MNATFDFSGKKVIVTGASGIFGTWVSRAFTESGADLWLAGCDGENQLALADELRALRNGANIKTACVDLRVEKDIAGLRDCVARDWGSPDFVINIAGIYPASLLADTDTELWDSVMELNVRGTFLMIRYFSKLMIDRKIPGVFVNFISRSGLLPRVGAVPYSASKAAVEIMTRGYAMELAGHGIRVVGLSPGFAPRTLSNPYKGAGTICTDEYVDAMLKRIPMGRSSGPGDAPQAVLFLCSDNAAYITGSSVYVDGGTSGDYALPVHEAGRR